jgi:hypothetical protein
MTEPLLNIGNVGVVVEGIGGGGASQLVRAALGANCELIAAREFAAEGFAARGRKSSKESGLERAHVAVIIRLYSKRTIIH